MSITTPTDAQIDALRAAASNATDTGLSFDEVTIKNTGDGEATIATPEETHVPDIDSGEFASIAIANGDYVTNWYYWNRTLKAFTDAEREYLQWLERAEEENVPDRYEALGDGITRTWGELQITTTLATHDGEPGERRYSVRNERDTESARADLEQCDPEDARRIARLDDSGRYRPLKTAPTLRAGWEIAGLDASELLRTIDRLYPVTVQNWHMACQGELDVTHWRETAERQTGIYDLVDELPQESVEWLAEACCVDSQCLKRRKWDYEEETPLDVPRGEGEFPCREPCSLVISCARKFTILESEDEREYTFSLTPSEKAQVEEIIEAVADGRINDIREGDIYDSANRYRARYLMAKRFRDGELPTES